MDVVNIADAKSQLSALIERVEAGETITIARRGRPVAMLSPATPPRLLFRFRWSARR